MSSTQIALTVTNAVPSRLDKALCVLLPEELALSRSRLAKLISVGAVTVNGAVEISSKAKVRVGDDIGICLPAPEPSHMAPEQISLNIVYEDDDLIVLDKPAGMVVHPAPGSPRGTLANALLAHCAGRLSGIGGIERPGIVHRIDKDTSGLIVVAKSDVAHSRLAEQFAAHSVERLYQAITIGVPDPANPRLRGLPGVSLEAGGVLKIATALDRHRTDRKRRAVVSEGGRHAVTRVRVIRSFGDAALVDCWLETGRTHQIRVHLAHVGHGLVGDPIYGRARKLRDLALQTPFPRQALHAAILGFVHPITGRGMRFECPPPTDFATLIDELEHRHRQGQTLKK